MGVRMRYSFATPPSQVISLFLLPLPERYVSIQKVENEMCFTGCEKKRRR